MLPWALRGTLCAPAMPEEARTSACCWRQFCGCLVPPSRPPRQRRGSSGRPAPASSARNLPGGGIAAHLEDVLLDLEDVATSEEEAAAGSLSYQKMQTSDRVEHREDNAVEATSSATQIRKDLPRTFPKQGVVRSCADHIEEVLQQYALRDPGVGYCQGMNCVAAVVVTHLRPDWSSASLRFSQFIWQLRGLWLAGFPLFFLGSLAFRRLGGSHMPQLCDHLYTCGFTHEMLSMGILAGEWLSLFSRWLPFAELWGVFELIEKESLPGLLGLTVALLQVHTAALLKVSDFTALFVLLKDLHAQPQPEAAKLLASARKLLPAAREAVSEAQRASERGLGIEPRESWAILRTGSRVIHSSSNLEVVIPETADTNGDPLVSLVRLARTLRDAAACEIGSYEIEKCAVAHCGRRWKPLTAARCVKMLPFCRGSPQRSALPDEG